MRALRLSVLCLSVFVLLPIMAIAGEVIPLTAPATGASLLVEGDGTEILTVTMSELRLDAVEIDGLQWAVVRVPAGHNLMNRGEPSLPFLTAEYLLEATGGIELELIGATTRDIDLTVRGFAGVAPSRGHFNRNIDPATVPYVFSPKIYGAAVSYPSATVWMDDPFIAGPLRGQSARIPVATWHSGDNRLTVVEEARFRVVHTATAPNPRTRPEPPMTGLFDQIARHRMVNYDLVRGRYTLFVEAGRLLILSYDDFVDEAQPLADWQRQVGYPTMLVPMSTAGTTASQVYSYIQSLYNQPDGLTWIILVGDAAQVPFLSGVNEGADCDPCYTKLEGGDNRPDAAISRISAQSGADVTIQVDKILEYERFPDQGSAAVWYPKAFGVAGDADNIPPPDWQRMELLRQVLVEPAYTYTEFTQVYHDSATPTQVAAAVNDGRSLGLYIGHGWELGWGTSGFDVNHVNTLLSNNEMLPVIWSVACLNGRFAYSGGDCFGEAWLQKTGGGAVSFEGATTNESWVPPCDAQRGIIDSLRLGTAFTTGGEHVDGKLYCMDVNGAGNYDEGTKFMEQSTLFGTCTTWMRTLPPQIPDEPVDFSSSGGVASLTVTVGGLPLAKANAAIVSFYTLDGGLTLVGSGLIDDTGMVHATITGEPTHCHIHGQNLLPQSFELAARPDGRVSLDAEAYGCSGTVTVGVSDSNVPGSSPATIDTLQVTLAVPGDTTTVTLTEAAADRSLYSGTAVLGSDLTGSHGDPLTATYIDADDGAGGVNVIKTDTALLDCAGPVIGGLTVVDVGATTAVVEWTTDEPADSLGVTDPGGIEVSVPGLRSEHRLEFAGLEQCTVFTVQVASTDALGNVGAGGPTPPFATLQETVALEDDIEAGVGGWVVDTATGGGVNWTIVADGHAHSPTHAWFTADYGAVKDDRLVAGPVTLGGGTTTLSFWHEYNTEGGWDGGVLEVSTNGTTWQDVTTVGAFVEGGYTGTLGTGYSNPLQGREAWSGSSGGFVHTVVDLSGLAGTELWFRFRFGCDSMSSVLGWWVDDILLETISECSGMPFVDGFESGDCSMWSAEVP